MLQYHFRSIQPVRYRPVCVVVLRECSAILLHTCVGYFDHLLPNSESSPETKRRDGEISR